MINADDDDINKSKVQIYYKFGCITIFVICSSVLLSGIVYGIYEPFANIGWDEVKDIEVINKETGPSFIMKNDVCHNYPHTTYTIKINLNTSSKNIVYGHACVEEKLSRIPIARKWNDCHSKYGSYPYQRDIAIKNLPLWFCSPTVPTIGKDKGNSVIMMSKEPTHKFNGKLYHDISFFDKPYFPNDDYIIMWVLVPILSGIIFCMLAYSYIKNSYNLLDIVKKASIKDYNKYLILISKNIHDINLVFFSIFIFDKLKFKPYEGNIIFMVQIAFFFWLLTTLFKIMIWLNSKTRSQFKIDFPVIGNFYYAKHLNEYNIFNTCMFPIYAIVQYIPQIIFTCVYLKSSYVALISFITSILCIIMFLIFVLRNIKGKKYAVLSIEKSNHSSQNLTSVVENL